MFARLAEQTTILPLQVRRHGGSELLSPAATGSTTAVAGGACYADIHLRATNAVELFTASVTARSTRRGVVICAVIPGHGPTVWRAICRRGSLARYMRRARGNGVRLIHTAPAQSPLHLRRQINGGWSCILVCHRASYAHGADGQVSCAGRVVRTLLVMCSDDSSRMTFPAAPATLGVVVWPVYLLRHSDGLCDTDRDAAGIRDIDLPACGSGVVFWRRSTRP